MSVELETRPARNPDYEASFLREAATEATRRFGVRCDAFPGAVAARLALGEGLYGNKWVELDLAAEILEEAHDAAAYALLDAQKTLASPTEVDDARAWYAFEVAVVSAHLDSLARMLRHPD
jgi:hypothetical protein